MADPAVGEGAHDTLNRAYTRASDDLRVTTTTPSSPGRSITEKVGIWTRVSASNAVRVRRV